MKNRVVGSVRRALTLEKDRQGAFEKSLRACIRFYQQGKIRGEAKLGDYFVQELGVGSQISDRDLLESAIVVGLSFGSGPAFDKTLELCRLWGMDPDGDDAVAYAMLAGVLAALAEGEPLKKAINRSMGKMLEGENHEALIEHMKLVVALYESGKPVSRSVAFLDEGKGFYEVFGAALLVALKAGTDDAVVWEDLKTPVAVAAGALAGASGRGPEDLPQEGFEETAVHMAEDLYEIVHNNVILPFDKYAPTLES